MDNNCYRLGLDVGSTTAKIVILDPRGEVAFCDYRRHQADIDGVVSGLLHDAAARLGDPEVAVTVTGSVGMGIAERFAVPFVQEVIAAVQYVRQREHGIATIIDIGGEDAKIVYLRDDGQADLRMNGNCAGGTGAFIDQMALLLGTEIDELDTLAGQATHIHPIASRCGVFSKTDVQNLISKNVPKTDIAASIFHAVAVQTVTTLSHGCELKPGILFCGGPLTFIPALRQAFINHLGLPEEDFRVPDRANLIPAWGAALHCDGSGRMKLSEFISQPPAGTAPLSATPRLPRIFPSAEAYGTWIASKAGNRMRKRELKGYSGDAYLGIDSGSTTTKIAVTDGEGNLLYHYYAPNGGDPIGTVGRGLERLAAACAEQGASLGIRGSCSTGYGEDLIRAAYSLDEGIIETIAHYLAARDIDPQVSFILDIGGQDMKAIFVDHGVLSRMEINEACSSGCGSFIETFANSLGYAVADFAAQACLAERPCDLGTRCTVFMNSKVKQVLREGATVADIAAGLSYSVVKNCLYKVLKLKKREELGDRIVVQGGTMRNDSVVRALELLTGAEVSRSDMPGLMGAYGCALYARTAAKKKPAASLDSLLASASHTSRRLTCGGCENHCFITKYTFAGNHTYYSGNKCEKVFSNRGTGAAKGRNVSAEKNALLFDRPCPAGPRGRIGIPRVLNMYEDYPFWHALLSEAGFEVVLSSPSTYRSYEAGVHSVMSDNICFPAKLAHSHIYELAAKGVDRIFYPWAVYEKPEGPDTRNSYNCPVVAGYPEVVRNAIMPEVPVDSPVVTFRDAKKLRAACRKYLTGLGVESTTVRRAIRAAFAAQEEYEQRIATLNRDALAESRAAGGVTILLAGRPYHTDPLVQHKISDMITDMGATVITEDIVRGDSTTGIADSHLVTQWSYINRILRAAHWAAAQQDVHFVQTTSFGCGPDAFLLDETRNVLQRHGKSFTLLKIDDVNNIGSLKLRVRSVIESIRFGNTARERPEPFVTTKTFTKSERRRTLLAPFFTDYVSPLVPAAFRQAGYEIVQLPESDNESAEYGLRYANNEVCYPATLVVGDLIKALDSGRYDLDETAVIITQTGGQCRATNYVALLKRAMVEAGYAQVPVISLGMGSSVNPQPGFGLNWAKFLPLALAAVLLGDCISKFYHSAAVREIRPGEAMRLREAYLEKAKEAISRNAVGELYGLVGEAARSFDAIIEEKTLPKVGIVGEIYLKFNSFAHKRVVRWLVEHGVEVVPPVLTDFFMEAFVNRSVKHRTGVQRSPVPLAMLRQIYGLLWRKMEQVNRDASAFRYFTPFHNIYEQAERGREVISLSAQFGEGWLLPAEIVTFARTGVNNVVSLQPFGCIANHIVSKGVEKRIKTLYPQMHLLSLDFDSGVSDVNVTNRLMLLTDNIR